VRDPGAEPPVSLRVTGKSTTSDSSRFASSIPATSANVTRSPVASYRRARERPNAPRTFCTLPARRINQTRSSTNRIVGPNPSSRLCHHGGPVSNGWALTTTPFCSSKAESASLFANAGISVLNRVAGFPSNCTFCVKDPWIAVPFEVISSTWPARTCCRKNGVYGTRTRAAGCVARLPKNMLIANRPRKRPTHTIQPGRPNLGVRGGEGCCAGPPEDGAPC